MPILNDEVRDHVQNLFADRLRDPVTLDFYTQPKSSLYIPGRRDCESCEDAQQLYEEVSALSEKVDLRIHDIRQEQTEFTLDDLPLLVMSGHNLGTVRILGVPAGYEFVTLLEDIVDLSTGETALSEETRESLAGLEADLSLQVFVTPT
jgi:alkyl hydroperoxide reductase subunit AhpF